MEGLTPMQTLKADAEFDHDLTFWSDVQPSLDLSPISDLTPPVLGSTPPCLMESLGMPELQMDISTDEGASSLLNIAEEIGGLFNEDLSTGAGAFLDFDSPLNTPDVIGELQLCAHAPVSASAASAEVTSNLDDDNYLDIDKLLRDVSDDVIGQFPLCDSNLCKSPMSCETHVTHSDDVSAHLSSFSDDSVRLSFDDVNVDDVTSPVDGLTSADVDYFEVFTDLSKEIEQEFGIHAQSHETNELTADVTPQPSTANVTSPLSTIELADITDLLAQPAAEIAPALAPASRKRKRGRSDVSDAVVDSVRADHDYVGKVSVGRTRSKKIRVSKEANENVSSLDVAESSNDNHCALVQSTHISSNSCFTTTSHDETVFKKPLPVVLSSPKSTAALKSTPAPQTQVTKYREKRDKNNVASQRSRRMRKEKFLQMDDQAVELEAENRAMRLKIVKMEALAKAMREALVSKISGK